METSICSLENLGSIITINSGLDKLSLNCSPLNQFNMHVTVYQKIPNTHCYGDATEAPMITNNNIPALLGHPVD